MLFADFLRRLYQQNNLPCAVSVNSEGHKEQLGMLLLNIGSLNLREVREREEYNA